MSILYEAQFLSIIHIQCILSLCHFTSVFFLYFSFIWRSELIYCWHFFFLPTRWLSCLKLSTMSPILLREAKETNKITSDTNSMPSIIARHFHLHWWLHRFWTRYKEMISVFIFAWRRVARRRIVYRPFVNIIICY